MKNVLSLLFEVSNCRVKYDNKALVEKKLEKFLSENNGEFGEITYTIHSGVPYYLHKYFHGFVRKHIAMVQGEANLDYVKEVLKEDFLFFKVDDIKQIPARHLKKCNKIIERKFDIDGRLCVDEKGRPVYNVIGYIPSLSSLSVDEYREFIEKCEYVRDGLIGWSMTKDEKERAVEYRKRAFEIDN